MPRTKRAVYRGILAFAALLVIVGGAVLGGRSEVYLLIAAPLLVLTAVLRIVDIRLPG